MNQPYRPLRREPAAATRIKVAPVGGERAFAAARRHTTQVRLLRFALPVLALVGATAYGAVTLTREALAPVEFAGIEVGPDSMVMQRPRMTGFQASGEPYRIEAARATQQNDLPGEVGLEDVVATFSLGNGENATVEAAQGLYDSEAATLTLSGGLSVTTEGGLVARLESAEVELDSGSVRSDAPVEIESAGRLIRGNRFEMRDGGAELALAGGVSVTGAETASAPAPGARSGTPFGAFQSDTGGPVDITADALEQTREGDLVILTFTGNVVASRDGTVVRAPTVVVEAPAAESGGDAFAARDFDRIEATGGVRVESGGMVATGAGAEVDMVAGSAVMTGDVVLSEGDSRLSGSRMIVDMASSDMAMESGTGARVRFFTPSSGSPQDSGAVFSGFAAGSGGATEVLADSFVQTTRGDDLLLRFTGNVVADRGGSVIRSATLTVSSPAGQEPFDAGSFERLDASGNVVVQSEGQTATGDDATVDLITGIAVMTGEVTLDDGGNQLSGDRLTVDMNAGVLVMEPLNRAILTPRSGAAE